MVHVDTWILPLKYILASVTSSSGSIPLSSSASWERIPRKGEYPSSRAGTTSVMLSSSSQQQSSPNMNTNKLNNNCMIVFGGVMDNEGDHHIIESMFYNDLFIFDIECKRWTAVQLAKDDRATKRDVGKENNDEIIDTAVLVMEGGENKNEEVKSNGFGLNELRRDMFAFTDGGGNIVFENIDGIVLTEEEEDEDDEVEMDKDEALLLATKPQSITSEITETSTTTRRLKGKKGKKVKKVDLTKLPPVLPKIRETPLPRINCASIIRNNTLYIYGGLVEVGDREVTLDDCWSIDLNKYDKKWNCVYPGRMHKQVWKGVDSDNDSYISSDQGADDDDDDDDDDVAEFEPILEAEVNVDDDDDDDEDEEEQESKEKAEKRAKKEAKKAKDKEKRHAIRNEVAELKKQLDDNIAVRQAPLLGESITEFYSRTTQYWNEEVTKSSAELETLKSTNQGESDMMQCEGFCLANVRYEEVKQIRDRLYMLERLQLEYDEKKAKKKTDKKLKKDRLR